MSPHQQPASTAGKVEELESIRGLAALLIVFHHFPRWNEATWIGLFSNAGLMVEVFFVLSGFVICNAYAEKLRSPGEVLRFQFLRFGRLYPVHLLLLLACTGVELAKHFAETRLGIVNPNGHAFQTNTWTAFVHHLLLVQGIGPTGTADTFNGPAWSISVEFYTYLLFALVVLYCTKVARHVMFALCVVSLSMLITRTTFGFDYLLRCVAGFFLGCLVAFAAKSGRVTMPPFSVILAFLGLVLFVSFKPAMKHDFVVYFLTALLILAIVSSRDNVWRATLRWKPLVWLGSISYSLYMCHWLVVWIANQVFRVVLRRPEVIAGGRSTPVLSLSEALLAEGLTVAVVLVTATLLYRLVEVPWRQKSRRLARA